MSVTATAQVTYKGARDVRPDLAGLGPDVELGQREAEDAAGVVGGLELVLWGTD